MKTSFLLVLSLGDQFHLRDQFRKLFDRTQIRTAALLLMCMLITIVKSQAALSIGKIAVAGDEWGFSDAQTISSNYVANVISWFNLLPGKQVLMLDGQSWNGGFRGTFGAFGSQFRETLTGKGVVVTYLGYTDPAVVLSAYDAVFVCGWLTNYTSLTSDLATFVHNGGAVFVAGGTGTFPDRSAKGEADYWQPFFTAATGSNDFGLGVDGWFEINSTLTSGGPIGDGVSSIDWYAGQDVKIGSSVNAQVAVSDSSHNLVAIWSSRFEIGTQPRSQVGTPGESVSFYVITDGGTNPITYQWFKSGYLIENGTNSTLALSDLRNSDEGLYNVIATDHGGNKVISDSASLTIQLARSQIALYPGIKVNGSPGLTYGIQSMANVNDTNGWRGVGNVTLTSAEQIWHEAMPATHPIRLYRVVPGPISIP